MKAYESVLLDWDGNLAQTLDIWLEACHEVLARYGHILSDEEIGASFGAFPALAEKLGIANPHNLMQEADEIAIQKLPDVELYPDALEVLAYLHDKGKEMALITSSSTAHIAGLLDKYDLRKFFSVVVTGDDITHHKPHPESLLKAMGNLAADPYKTLLIGDSDKDLGAAANVGIDSVLFYPPAHRKFYNLEVLKRLNPTYIINNFTKIKDIVK